MTSVSKSYKVRVFIPHPAGRHFYHSTWSLCLTRSGNSKAEQPPSRKWVMSWASTKRVHIFVLLLFFFFFPEKSLVFNGKVFFISLQLR